MKTTEHDTYCLSDTGTFDTVLEEWRSDYAQDGPLAEQSYVWRDIAWRAFASMLNHATGELSEDHRKLAARYAITSTALSWQVSVRA